MTRQNSAASPQYNEEGNSMTRLLAVCCIAMFAGYATQTSAQEKQTLRLVQTIPLPGVKGPPRPHGRGCGKEALVCGYGRQQHAGNCGPDCREGDQKPHRIQGHPGRAVPGR